MEPNVAMAGLTLALSLFMGVLSFTVARHLRVPGIIVLLVVGFVVGPDVLGVVNPMKLGEWINTIIGMAVAVILFEGGLHMDLRRLRKEGATIRRLITYGAILTGVLSAVAARMIMQWDWTLSLLFGSLVIVTGPTVVTPLLRRLRIQKNVSTILEAEGVLIDPIGALIAIVALEFVLTSSEVSAVQQFLSLGAKVGVGALIGVVAGYVIAFFLKREELIPDEFENIFALSASLLTFELSNYFQHESGIMAVTLAGTVVCNTKIPTKRKLVDFKEQLTYMFIGALFILLTANVRYTDIRDLGWPGVMTVLAIMLVVRPINVMACSVGSNLTWKEKLFMSWLAPRGIVAAAVASIFAFDLERAGIPGGEQLRALVFLVILMTVVLQGFSSSYLAKALDIKRKFNTGYLIIGGNALGRLLGRLLVKRNDEEVIIMDTNSHHCHLAQNEGLKVHFGNALEEKALVRAGTDAKRAVICVTPDDATNIVIARRIRDFDKKVSLYLSMDRFDNATNKHVDQFKGKLLFAQEIDKSLWNHHILHNDYCIREVSLKDEGDAGKTTIIEMMGEISDLAVPIVINNKQKCGLVNSRTRLLQDEVLVAIVIRTRLEEFCDWATGKKLVVESPIDNEVSHI